MRLECVSRTHVGLRRKINEDSVFVDSERGLWAVADGMGGHEAGEIASTMATDALRCLPVAHAIDELAGRAVEALHQVNRELRTRQMGRASAVALGTTGRGGPSTMAHTVCSLAIVAAYCLGTRNPPIPRDPSLVQSLRRCRAAARKTAKRTSVPRSIRAPWRGRTIEAKSKREARPAINSVGKNDGMPGSCRP